MTQCVSLEARKDHVAKIRQLLQTTNHYMGKGDCPLLFLSKPGLYIVLWCDQLRAPTRYHLEVNGHRIKPDDPLDRATLMWLIHQF